MFTPKVFIVLNIRKDYSSNLMATTKLICVRFFGPPLVPPRKCFGKHTCSRLTAVFHFLTNLSLAISFPIYHSPFPSQSITRHFLHNLSLAIFFTIYHSPFSSQSITRHFLPNLSLAIFFTIYHSPFSSQSITLHFLPNLSLAIFFPI